jgi:hypothetical protein
MQTACQTRRRRRPLMALPSLAMMLAGSSGQAAVLLTDLDLGGTQQSTIVWENLTGSNLSRTPTSGTGGTINHSASAFQGTFGFYSFTADYTVTATQTATFDISSVVWQIECSPNPDLAWPYPQNGGPVLTVVTSSGSQVVVPIAYREGNSELRSNFGPDPIPYTAFAWQWDLSSISDTINSISLSAPISVHTSVSASQIDVGNAFFQVIPEPSSLLLSFAALPLIARRRRTID